MTGKLIEIRKRLSFLYLERSILAGKDEITTELENALGEKLSLKRFYRGSGWGLKYVAFTGKHNSGSLLVKAASAAIEKRIKNDSRHRYLEPDERLKREAEILRKLSVIGRAPRVVHAGRYFFAREFVEGRAVNSLPSAEKTGAIAECLAALDQALDHGIFHTDTNASNLILTGSGVMMIDSEVPRETLVGEEQRVYCHERFLSSLFDSRSVLPETISAVEEYYRNSSNPVLTPERAVSLLGGENWQTIRVPK